MENVLDHQETIGKVYTNHAITIGTFIGGPLVAGYLVVENFKSLNQFEKIRSTWLIAILSTVLIFGLLLLLPESITSNFPPLFIPLLYLSFAQIGFKKYQEKDMALYIEKGGSTHSVMRALGIGLIGLILTFLIMVIIGFFAFIAMDMMQ